MESVDKSFDVKFRKLQIYITGSYPVECYSNMFSSLSQNYEKVGMAYCLLAEARLLPGCEENHTKSSKKSLSLREKGNKEFLQKKDLFAIQTYSASIALAPGNSEELALAFANRSAVTYSLQEYATCIKDIDKALMGKYPDHLRYKLFERKGNCLKLLGLNKSAKDTFKIAKEVLSSSYLDEEKRKSVSLNLDKKLNSCTENDIYHEKEKENCVACLSENKNNIVLSASSLIQVEYSDKLGRHLVANANIEPGDVLVMEEPFASVLLPTSFNIYCFQCKRRCHALIPCLYCVVAMYCSEECRSDSWNENHRIECTLIPLLLELEFTKIEFIALRTLLTATRQSNSLQDFLKSIQQIETDSDPKTKGLDDKGCYDSSNYRSVHHLITNIELRSNADIFRKAATAAYLLHLLYVNTDYFSTVNNDEPPLENLNNINDKSLNMLNTSKLMVGGLLLRYLMIVPSNAHEVSEMVLKKVGDDMHCENIEIGGALYPVLSLINHSCDPNVVRHSHKGDYNVLTAIQAIRAGEQIFDNYGYHHALHDLSTRQNKLWSQYLFKCGCIACTEDWPLYPQLPCSEPVLTNYRLKDELEKSSQIFKDVLSELNSGNMERKLAFLYAHLSLLQQTIKRPWKEFSECQEAIKQCLGAKANHYRSPC